MTRSFAMGPVAARALSVALLAALALGACAKGATGGKHGDSGIDIAGDGKDGGGAPGTRDSGTPPLGMPDAGKSSMDASAIGDAAGMMDDGAVADVVVHDDAAIVASMDASTCATSGTCDFGYTPTNFDPSKIDPGAADAITTLSCAVTFDSSGAAPTFPVCGAGAKPTVTIETLMGGDEVAIVALRDLVIPAGGTLRLTGARPVILAVFGNATIGGTIDASANRATPGAGGSTSCTVGTGPNGNDSDTNNLTAGSGGGGGAFATAGGGGGAGTGSCCAAVAGGMVEGDAMLDPLRGGCSGGRGGLGNTATASALGGAGGGAVQISASGTLTITGHVTAAGGGGTNGAGESDGGGGGGSGGAIVLEGNDVNVAMGASLTANGGGGAGGNPRLNTNGDDGANGGITASVASGGSGDNSSGDGGDGAAGTVGAQVGADASGLDGRGGGGGGGGAGRIRITADGTCTQSGTASPAASGC